MDNKPIHRSSSRIKQLFVREFAEFKNEFDFLSEKEDFADMLKEYLQCESEIERRAELHNVRATYLQLKGELKDEIIVYIIKKIKAQDHNEYKNERTYVGS
jgi:hypothetical protein